MIRIVLFCLFWPVTVWSQTDLVTRMENAADALEQASQNLAQAGTGRARITALTRTILAYEDGLDGLRLGLREVRLRRDELNALLVARESEISGLLAGLQSVNRAGSPSFMMHPGGPTGAARAGMLLADVTTTINQQALALRKDLSRLAELDALQAQAKVQFETGLSEVQIARQALSEAMAERTDLPKRFINDPVRSAVLEATSNTIEAFLEGLDDLAGRDLPKLTQSFEQNSGGLSLPVQGQVLLRPNQKDAVGTARAGLVLETPANALVTSPSSATIRYIGPLLDYGQVVILEPGSDTLFIFMGLDQIYGQAGEVIDAGTPLGLMGVGATKKSHDLSTDGDWSGAELTETLYIEVRQYNKPEDPSEWFRTDENG